jgi:2-amino-4-hydroxy-6-hydroxymethyldihydropteridine diphosphokinase
MKDSEEWVEAYIGLGANLEDRAGHLRRALHRLEADGKLRVTAVSPVYETAARIVEDQPDFLNACAKVETTLPADKLMGRMLAVEESLGRRRRRDKGARKIDLDLLLYGSDTVEQPELTVPHPGLVERRFVLVPLADLAPDLVPPGMDRTISDLRDACADAGALDQTDVRLMPRAQSSASTTG